MAFDNLCLYTDNSFSGARKRNNKKLRSNSNETDDPKGRGASEPTKERTQQRRIFGVFGATYKILVEVAYLFYHSITFNFKGILWDASEIANIFFTFIGLF